jgi:uncharacterized membrane protein YkvA (DUF1232 family)
VTSSSAGWLPKLLAIVVLIYLISPVDLLPGIAPISWLDDAVVAWGAYLLLESLMNLEQGESEQSKRKPDQETFDTTARVNEEADRNSD